MSLDLEDRLADLGPALDLDEPDALVTGVLARIAEADAERRRLPAGAPRVAAVAVLLVAALLVVPSSRRAIADWFGLDGVDIDRDPSLTVPAEPPPVGEATPIGTGSVADVEGTDVLVGAIEIGEAREIDEIDGRLDEAYLSKSLAAGTAIEQVDVGGNPGLWIDGAPHVVTFRSPGGHLMTERIAGNTLLWQDGDVIRRLEGFATLADALAYAER